MVRSEPIRFGVRAPDGRQSSVRRLWTHNGDVYIAARSIAGELKASLHKSGVWRWALTEAHQRSVGSLIAPEADRAVRSWRRPPEVGPGLTRALEIVVPSS